MSRTQTKLSLATLLLAIPVMATSAEVELRSPDGFLSVEGEITAFDGNMYTIRTSVGSVSVPVSEVLCYGADCPPGAPRAVEEVTLVIGYDGLGDRGLLDLMLAASAEISNKGFDVNLSDTDVPQIVDAALSETVNLSMSEFDDSADTDLHILSTNAHLATSTDTSSIAAWANPEGAQTQLISLKGFSVLVSPDAGMTEISVIDLARIYAGEVTNWSSLGGADQAINALKVQENTTAHNDLVSMLMTPAGKDIARTILTVKDEATMVTMVGRLPGAVTVVSQGAAETATAIPVVNTCGQPVLPTSFDIKTGRYPLVQATLAKSNNADVQSVVSRFIDTAALPALQSVIGDAGYIEQSIDQEDPDAKALRFNQLLQTDLDSDEKTAARDFLNQVFDAQRLSIGLADGDVTSTQGALYRADFVRLADAINAGNYDGQDVLFLGFASAGAGTDVAIETAQQAADNILAGFRTFAPEAANRPDVSLIASGFGPLSTDLCDASDVTANSNHVEVWTRPSVL